MIRASAAARKSGGPLLIWLCADSTVTSNAFANTAYENDAVALEGMGYDVTRRQTSTISSAPLKSDCDAVLVINGTPGGETLLRATAATAAPVLSLNSYNLGNAWGSLAIASGSPGTNDGSASIVITNHGQIPWTNGHVTGDTVAISGSAIYMERVNTPVSGAFIMLRSTTNVLANVSYAVPAGTTNLASVVTTARIATFHIFDNIKNLNANGQQILRDLITWVTS
jgi:hypothetical protein